MNPLLELESVEKTYRHPSGRGDVSVLKDVSLTIEEGSSQAVLGPSGSGKSTLLNLMGALDRPSAGRVLFRGRDLGTLDDAALSRIRNREIGFVFQLHHLLPQCTVLENVMIPTIPAREDGDLEDPDSRARFLLDKVGLGGHTDHFPAQVSGGELQRAAVVRALINRPRLVLADEPTGSLDSVSAAALGRLLVELNSDEGTALVVVTHSGELAKLMGAVYTLQNGRLARGE